MRNAFPAVAALVTSCATVGPPIDFNRMAELKVGVTTEADARLIFGPPYMVVAQSDGSRRLIWSYVHVNTFVGTQSQTMVLPFGSDGKLVAVPGNPEAPPTAATSAPSPPSVPAPPGPAQAAAAATPPR